MKRNFHGQIKKAWSYFFWFVAGRTFVKWWIFCHAALFDHLLRWAMNNDDVSALYSLFGHQHAYLQISFYMHIWFVSSGYSILLINTAGSNWYETVLNELSQLFQYLCIIFKYLHVPVMLWRQCCHVTSSRHAWTVMLPYMVIVHRA